MTTTALECPLAEVTASAWPTEDQMRRAMLWCKAEVARCEAASDYECASRAFGIHAVLMRKAERTFPELHKDPNVWP